LIGLAELLALAGVAHRLGQRRTRHAEAHGAGDDADLAQGLAQVAFAVAFFLGQAMAVGDEAFVEGDFGSRQRPDAHLVDFATDGDALEMLFDEEDGQLLLLAGFGEDGEEVGHRRRGDPGLLAVDDVAAVDLLRRGGDGIEVGAGIRFGHADGADLLAAQRRLEQALDDVLVAQQMQELGAHQRLHGHRARQRHRAARDFLQRQRELGQRRAATADFLGIAHAEEAEVGQFLEQGARILLGFVQRGGLRRDALVAEAGEGVADLLLVFGEFEIHLCRVVRRA
jgi:hypothetical protein